MFYWNGTFSYNGADKLDKEIDTDLSDVTNYNVVNNNGMLSIPPGRFDIDGVDNKGENIRLA